MSLVLEKDPVIYCDSIRFLSNYYNNQFPMSLGKSETYDLIKLSQKGDIVARNAIIDTMYRFIYQIALKCWTPQVEIDDLFQVGVLGCIKAIERFNLDLDYSFITFAAVVIRNDIRMYIRSERLQVDLISIDTPLINNDKGDKLYLVDILEDDSIYNNPELYLEALLIRDLVVSELDQLDEMSQFIITRSFGLDGSPKITQSKIADVLGYSQAHVSRLRKSILSNIRRNIEFKLW